MAADPNIQEKGINCVPLWVIHSILAVIITTSIIFNSFVIQFTRKELKTRSSTYMICLFCMSVNNLVATCVSLPLHYVEFYTTNIIPHVPLPLSNAICFLRFVSLFTHLGVGICALNIICWDRYEALTRLGKERRITPSIAGRAILGTALFVIVYVVCSMIVPLRQMADGVPYCFMRQSYSVHNFTYKYTGKQIEGTSTTPIVVLVATIMVSSKTIAIFTFSSITNQVRQHIEKVKETLGPLNTTKELNLVKVSVVIFMAYTMTWLPYGISSALFGALGNVNEGISCFYYTSHMIAYSLFSVLPLLCAITDKKMKSKLLRKRINNRVAPINGQSRSDQQTRQTTNSDVTK